MELAACENVGENRFAGDLFRDVMLAQRARYLFSRYCERL